MNDVERELRELGERTAEHVTYREAPRARIVRRARLRRAAIVAAPVAAVVLFAAVAYPRLGSDVNRGVPVSVDMAAVAEATEDAGSARLEMSMTMEFGGRTITMHGEGEVDFDDSRAYLRLTGDGAVYGVGGELEMISVGGTHFQRPVGDPTWVKTKVDVPGGGASFGARPDELFTYLESVSEDVTSLGEEVLDGVTVTHLRATLSTSALGEMGVGAGMEYEPIDVWIDESNRIRKMTFGGSMDGPDASSHGTMSMTMRFWDFGVPVDVEAPPPEDVTEEPPATWGGPGGELTGGEDSSEQETSGGIDEFGLESATYLTGPDGTDGPNVLLASAGDGSGFACFHELPIDTTSVTIVDEASGRRIVTTTGADRPEEVGDTGQSAGCAAGGISEEDVQTLVDDPTQFTLRLTMDDGRSETVEMTDTVPVAGDREE